MVYVTHQVEFLPAADLILVSYSNLVFFFSLSLSFMNIISLLSICVLNLELVVRS